MINLLTVMLPYIKAFHVMAVMSWMAGLFYLPRLFVYHAERGGSAGEPTDSFVIMEDKLLTLIMRPAMIATWISGLVMVSIPGIVDWSLIWPWIKGTSVIAMTWFHWWCAGQREALLKGQSLGGRGYRIMNEVPTLLMIVIVASVIIKF